MRSASPLPLILVFDNSIFTPFLMPSHSFFCLNFSRGVRNSG
jgi:hypothetical protein